MINHESRDPRSPPVRMDKQKRDISFVVLHVRDHEAEGDDDFLIEDAQFKYGLLWISRISETTQH